jgi:protein-disulfide isomerase
MQDNNNKLSIPAAIILAGLIIAVGILISNTKPAIPSVQVKENKLTQISFKPVNKDDHIIGSASAPVVIVEFSDTECPYCKMFQSTMKSVISAYGDKVAWVYRHSPIDSLHPKARKEAEATECANELGGNEVFWKYTDEIFLTTNSNNSLDPASLPVVAKDVGLDVTKFNTCLSSGKYASLVQSGIDDASSAGAQGTPYSLIIPKTPLDDKTVISINSYVTNNRLVDQYGNPYIWVSNSDNRKVVSVNGAMPLQMMKALIDIVLK